MYILYCILLYYIILHCIILYYIILLHTSVWRYVCFGQSVCQEVLLSSACEAPLFRLKKFYIWDSSWASMLYLVCGGMGFQACGSTWSSSEWEKGGLLFWIWDEMSRFHKLNVTGEAECWLMCLFPPYTVVRISTNEGCQRQAWGGPCSGNIMNGSAKDLQVWIWTTSISLRCPYAERETGCVYLYILSICSYLCALLSYVHACIHT